MARKPALPGADAFFAPPPGPQQGTRGPAADPGTDATDGGEESAGHGVPEVSSPQTGPQARTGSDAKPESEAFPTPTRAGLHDRLRLIAASPQPARSIPQPPTEKVTFYIPPQMLEQLEVCRVRLLTEHSIKAGRSQIVQAALALTVHDSQLLADALSELAEIWQDHEQ